MATRLEAVAVSRPGRRRRSGARALADDAIRTCLEHAGRAATDIDLLVNCGIYRDRNLGEPALAALIQEDVGANPGHPPVGGHGTFSFDVAGGRCGPLAAIEVVDGFLRSGTARCGVVVASDADPGHGLAPAFPFPGTGGAASLVWSDDRSGFSRFHQRSFPEYGDEFRAEVRWHERARSLPLQSAGRNLLVIDEAPGFAAHCVRSAETTVRDWLAAMGSSVDDVGALVTPAAEGVGARLADALGLPGFHGEAGAHTAGVLAALDAARRDGALDTQRCIVATVSAGIQVTVAMHEPPTG